jgi:hypothetical protein
LLEPDIYAPDDKQDCQKSKNGVACLSDMLIHIQTGEEQEKEKSCRNAE